MLLSANIISEGVVELESLVRDLPKNLRWRLLGA